MSNTDPNGRKQPTFYNANKKPKLPPQPRGFRIRRKNSPKKNKRGNTIHYNPYSYILEKKSEPKRNSKSARWNRRQDVRELDKQMRYFRAQINRSLEQEKQLKRKQ